MDDKLKQASSLVEQYNSLMNQRDQITEKLAELKQTIYSFASSNHMKNLKSDTHLLYISKGLRTFFPKKGTPDRKKVEDIIVRSKQLKFALSFDINKLSNAYERNALPAELKEKLTPYTKKEEVIRASIRKITTSSP